MKYFGPTKYRDFNEALPARPPGACGKVTRMEHVARLLQRQVGGGG